MKPTWCTLASACLALFASTVARATTYYVDSTAGSDSNSGTSSSAPWQSLAKVNGVSAFSPGDSILFARGGTWSGQLAPHGSGTSGSVITIDAYGSGSLPLPLIQGGGATYAALQLQNQSYWEIKHLEITNDSATAGSRVGVYIVATDVGALPHVHLVGLEVDNVNGNSTTDAGIYFNVTGSTTPTYFDDVLIDSCYVHDCSQRGIEGPYSSWSDRTPTTNTNWTPSTNVTISNNVVTNCTNQGLVWRVSSAPLIENNLFANNGQGGSGNAMFVFNCDGAVIQENEAYGQQFNTGDTDAAGFDIDYRTKNCVLQYNYAHDNGQGGITVTAGDVAFNVAPVVRYNILQNNHRRGFHFSGAIQGALVYNNTVYIGSGLPESVIIFNFKNWSGWPDGTTFYNNIIANYSTGASYYFGSSTNNVVDYNVFYNPNGAASGEPSDAHKLASDPKLAAPGSGGNGWSTVDGYKLLTGSPALTSGRVVSSNGGRDYWGNSVSSTTAPNRGAYNGAAVSPPPQTATPTFSPDGGTYTSAPSVTISCGTSGASIRYTTDGSTPTSTSGTVYSGPISITGTATLQAIAYASGDADSAVASTSFTLTTATAVNLEAENLTVTSSGATTQVVSDANTSGGKWVSLGSTATGQYMEFTTSSLAAGTYQLKLKYKGYTNRGKCGVTVDGTSVGGTVDQYSSASTYPTVVLGNVTFASTGTHTVRLTVNGKNSSSSSYALSADAFIFAPPPIALEAESLPVTSNGPATSTISDSNTSGSAWEYLASTAVGDYMEFTTTNIPAGTYQLQFRYKGFYSRGKHTVTVDGTAVGGTVDQYSSASTYPTTTLGNVTFGTDGTHAVRLTVNGQNASSTGYGLSADLFTLIPQ
ncbi:MAG TPA: chitobiase/beta-hexosaminidase C-terminal domain-containing protein [Opitutaceae bacterium]|nr:chitobiase/beta-hexosaminidase C-terminal domain-containing protein [Opitutaceae bacterium]